MGTFKARIGVSDGNGGPTEWVEALVDTGATWTVLPHSMLERIGIYPDTKMTFTYADGREVLLPVGEARLTVEGKATFNPVVFGEENRYLLGATSLQVFGLIADTTNHRLTPAPVLLL